jgi:glycosyltransferase involved in cell wall biosynthesis
MAYDFMQVVKAAELLSGCDIEFILQGKGETAESVKQLIRERCLSNVIVRDCILSREEVADFLGAADVLLLPLRDFGAPYLGISSKLYEYQALGKPIICCSHGCSADYVRDTGSGLIVAPGDHEGLAEAVRFLHDNPLEAETMGRAGREYVERHAGLEQIGVEMKQVLDNVIAEVAA